MLLQRGIFGDLTFQRRKKIGSGAGVRVPNPTAPTLLHTEIHVAVLADSDRSTFYAAVGKLLPDISGKVRACIKNNEWMFK